MTADISPTRHPREERFFYLLLCLGIAVSLFANICIFDDAYITFRVVDNFVHGYGLRWNVDDRVQVYTNPLWMLLHIPFYALAGNIYWVTIILSILCALAMFSCLFRLRLDAPLTARILLVLAPLAMSRTFRNHVICGLENPLTFVLFTWLLLEMFRPRPVLPVYRIAFIAGLLVITRFDTSVMLLPLLTVIALKSWRSIHYGKLLCALFPVIAWHLFSLWYYGFFFPNTKYAKMHMGVTLLDAARQGGLYLYHFAYYDPLAAVWILSALWVALSSLPGAVRTHLSLQEKETALSLLGIGFLLHIGYVVCIGGDFMPGRFFSNQLIIAVAILYLHYAPHLDSVKSRVIIALLSVAMLNGLVLQRLATNLNDATQHFGIDEQNGNFYRMNGMLSDPEHWLRKEPTGEWVKAGKFLETMAKQKPGGVVLSGVSGVPLYYAGPGVIIIDRVGIADTLLSRLPTHNPHAWRIGHPSRDIPPGYVHARETGDLTQMDPDIAQYYEKIRLITTGDLWDGERLRTILSFNAGRYDHLLQSYLAHHPSPAP